MKSMNMPCNRKRVLVAAVVLAAVAWVPGVAVAELIPLRSVDGVVIEAEIHGMGEDGGVHLQLANGNEFEVALERIHEEDRAAILELIQRRSEERSEERSAELKEINDAAGMPLFAGRSLWDEAPAELAGRMGLAAESATEFQVSYRAYTGPEATVFGARAYTIALYGEEGGTSRISIVFANLGDQFSAAGSGQDHFEGGGGGNSERDALAELQVAIERDAAAISETLTAAFGEPEIQRMGEGSGRSRVPRWDYKDHAFVLFNEEKKYVNLVITPVEFADGGGRTERLAGGEIRERSRANVENRDNGDVVIQNIPMVDQGPKGFCAPATFERCMRYMGVEADMYILASLAGTGLGGGTSVEALMEAVRRDVRRKGRTLDAWSGDVDLRRLRRFIDNGIPVVWSMSSTDAFNAIADRRTRQRAGVEDWQAYAEQVAAETAEADLHTDPSRGHVVIIHGYNPDTREIAFSDSWGERYVERWIGIDEAEMVSLKRFYVVDF